MPTLAQLYGAPKQAPTPLSSFAEETLTPIAEKLAPPTMPEVNPGIISLTGRALGGGLGAVGNLLDLPGSSVRDVLALRNPLDQWMDPLGYNAEENRVTGRDLLRQYGAVGEKDTWGNFAAGFAVDVATDPLSFTGIGNLNKAGTVAKNADMLGYAREVGNKTALDIAKDKAAKEGMTAKLTRPMRNVGSQSRVTTREIFDHLQKNDPDKYSELYQNWTNAGGTEDLLDMPLRDVASFRIPGLMKEAKTWRVKDAAADRADWSAKNSEFVGKPDLPNDPEAPVVDDVPDVDGGGGGTKTTDPVDPTDPAPTTQTTPTGVDPTGTQQSPFQIIRTKKGAVDYNKTRDAFRAISPNHEVFDEQLKAYEKGGALSKEESLLLQSVYSESDMEFANRMIGNVAEKESANGVIQPMASGYRVTLIPKGSSVKSPVSVLNHEMGHMAFFELEKTDSELFAAAQREIMEAIANGSLMKKFKITDGSVTGNMKLPGSPMRAEVQLAEYYQNKPHEVFAQLFSHAMDSKIPGDAIVGGGAVTELLKKAWEKIKSYVAKVIKSSDPNDPRLAAIEKLMDYTGGFKTADDRANILDALNNLKAQDGHSVKFFTEAGAQATGRTLMERAAARLGLMPPTDKTLLEDSYANAMFVEKETDGMFRVNIDEQKLKEAWPVNPSFKKPAVDPVNDPNNLVDVSNPAFTFESGKPAATLNSKLKQPNTLTPDDVEAAFEGIPTAQHGALAAFVRKLRPDLEQYIPQIAPTVPDNPIRENVYTVPTSALNVDPERFQYKATATKEKGVGEELKKAKKWNPEMGGAVLVWRDPADGKDYIVNGHHRHELAVRTGAKSMNARYISAETAKDARAIGALANIAEGRGTALDAAKYLRDSGHSIEHLEDSGISTLGKIASDAVELTKLSDKAFSDLAQGKIKESTAIAVAKHLSDHNLQNQMLKKFAKLEEAGKGWTIEAMETASRRMSHAGKTTATVKDLFGEWEEVGSTFDQEVQIETYIREQLKKEFSDYNAVSNTGRASRVSNVGNVLKVEANKKIAEQAKEAIDNLNTERSFRGPVADAIRSSAAALAKAKNSAEREAIKKNALVEVRSRLSQIAEQGLDAPGIVVPTRPNELAKAGDQLGMFGEVANTPGVKPTLGQVGETKGKQPGLFETGGDPDQMLLFDDGVATKDRTWDKGDAAESISPRKNEDGFYYNVDRLIQSGKLGGRVGFEQLKATAKKFGVKDEEIDDLDLASLFSDGKPKTRDEIQQWVDDNKIEIKTVEDEKYQGYQIPGGDPESYREVLISSAGKSGINTSGWTAKKNDYDEWDIFDANNEELMSFPGESANEAIAGAAKAMRENGVNPSGGPDYIGPHFRTPNVIAHLRMDDVTLPNGKKALRVQELQSDWHQKGKSGGWRPKSIEDLVAIERPGTRSRSSMGDNAIYDVAMPGGITKVVQASTPERAANVAFSLAKVPDGPFKKNWTNLALKHVLKEAAEKGYDEVMIVKGEDAARAVGGPEDALGTFYDQILNSDMKKLTKKWGSFEGIGNIPLKTKASVSWEGGSDWLQGEIKIGDEQWIADIERSGGKYKLDIDGHVNKEFDSAEKAREFVESWDPYAGKYSGDVQVFKVTPEMRRSLLEEGQAMYSLKPNPEKIKEAFQSFGKTWLSKVPEDSASAVADFIDRGGDLFYATTAGRALAGLFQADLFGAANSEIGREMGRARAKAMDEATIQFREAIDPAMTMLTKSGQMDMDTLIRGGKTPEEATAHVNKIANSIVRYFEGVDTLDDSINNPELIGALEAVRKIKDEVWQKVEDAGLKAPDLQDFFVKHFPRRKVDPGKSSMSINPRSGPVVEVSIDSQKRRDDLFRDIPGGTAVLNELSTDPVISGALHRPDFMKRKLSLEDMAVAKVEGGDVTMREYVYNQYGKDLLTEEKFDAFDPAKSTDLDRFIQYFADLDPKYADEGTALFGHNPIGDLANYMSDGNRVAEMAMTTQKLIARAARMEKFADAEPNKLHQIERLIGAGKGGLGFENTGKVLLNIAKNMEPEMQTAFKAALDNDVKKAMVELSQKKDVKRIVDGKEYVIKPKDVDANSNFSEIEVHYPKTVRELVNGEVVTKTIDDQPDIIDLASNPDYLKTMTEQYSAKKFLENFGVEDDIYKDATRFMKPWTSPEEYKVFERGLRRYINVMKAGLTAPWPAFHVRNFVSGSISNAMLGLTDPRYKKDPTGRALWQPIKDAYDLRANKPIDLRDIAGYNAKGADGKYILSDTEAMEKFQSEIFSMGIIGEKMGLAAEFIGDDLSSLASQKPGMNSEVNPLKGKFSPAPPNRTWFDYLNPLATRDGVTVGKSTSGNITPEVVRRDMFVGATAGKDVASFVEDLNRISGYIAARRQGAVPRAARAAVNKAQVDYSKLSSFESRYMRLLAPFYSYSRGMLPVTTMELIQNPGGPMATTIKLANRSRNPEEVVPDHIASTVGIPMGQTSDGSKRYLTGFGLGFEDSLNLLDGPLRMDPMATFRELGGRANPAIKGAIETMTGRSLFQDGPVGGKELTDLDPTIGRTLTNISDLVTGERTKKAEPFISPLFEQIVSNSPASRFASTARTLTDPRKWENPTTGLGLNILTGARVNDVSPQAQDVIYSERLAKELKAMGGRTYSRPYISDEREAEMTPEELARGQAILGEIDKLGKRFKARREEKEETEKIKAAVEKGT